MRFIRKGKWLPTLAGLLACVTLLAGCRDAEEPPEPPAQVVKLFETGQQQAFSGRRFVGRVDAVSTVNLAFQVGGRLTTFPAVQGTTLAKGELIAQLDQTDYALQVRAAEAELSQARQHLQRQENLYRHNAVSASVLEAARTDAELAATQLESARQELAYTSLYAPFDALIARRLVENHTTLPPNAEVVRIQDISELRIRINVPEALMQHLDGEHGFNAEAEIGRAYNSDRAREKTERIYETMDRVIAISKVEEITTGEAADRLAEDRLKSVRGIRKIYRSN